jgi:hypothetical protein
MLTGRSSTWQNLETWASGRLSWAMDEILSAPVEQEPAKALAPSLSGDIVFDNVAWL